MIVDTGLKIDLFCTILILHNDLQVNIMDLELSS